MESSVEEFRARVADAAAWAERIGDDLARYAVLEIREAEDQRSATHYLHGEELRAARKNCVRSIQVSARKFLATCDELILTREALDREVDQAFGLTGGFVEASNLAFHVPTAEDMQERVRALAGRYASQLEALHTRFDAEYGDLQAEHLRQMDDFKNSVARAHGVSLDVLDAAANAAIKGAEVLTGVLFVGGVLTAAGAAAAVFVPAALAVWTPLLAAAAVRQAANAFWEYWNRA